MKAKQNLQNLRRELMNNQIKTLNMQEKSHQANSSVNSLSTYNLQKKFEEQPNMSLYKYKKQHSEKEDNLKSFSIPQNYQLNNLQNFIGPKLETGDLN